MELTQLLTLCTESNASDLHLSVGLPPLLRVDSELKRVENLPTLDATTLQGFFAPILTEDQRSILTKTRELDFAIALPGVGRFRVNMFYQTHGLAAALRFIPEKIRTLDELEMPEKLKDIALLSRGLVLITGPTGSGKSTTLAAIIDHINVNCQNHIITIEDPIEYLHASKQCLIHQREVHRDTKSFNAALRAALREDPDVILVGEMRDLETIRLALTAAETGHLVLATLHTQSAAKTINRVIDVFPGEEKDMIRSMLSESLQAVVAQTLCKKVGGGRIAALEIMICTHAIRNLIREDKVEQMYTVLQTGTKFGMQTLEAHLMELVRKNLISKETAQLHAVEKDYIK